MELPKRPFSPLSLSCSQMLNTYMNITIYELGSLQFMYLVPGSLIRYLVHNERTISYSDLCIHFDPHRITYPLLETVLPVSCQQESRELHEYSTETTILLREVFQKPLKAK